MVKEAEPLVEQEDEPILVTAGPSYKIGRYCWLCRANAVGRRRSQRFCKARRNQGYHHLTCNLVRI